MEPGKQQIQNLDHRIGYLMFSLLLLLLSLLLRSPSVSFLSLFPSVSFLSFFILPLLSPSLHPLFCYLLPSLPPSLSPFLPLPSSLSFYFLSFLPPLSLSLTIYICIQVPPEIPLGLTCVLLHPCSHSYYLERRLAGWLLTKSIKVFLESFCWWVLVVKALGISK